MGNQQKNIFINYIMKYIIDKLRCNLQTISLSIDLLKDNYKDNYDLLIHINKSIDTISSILSEIELLRIVVIKLEK